MSTLEIIVTILLVGVVLLILELTDKQDSL